MDFSQEELFEVVDRLIAGMLERAGVTAPPVNALKLAESHLGIPIEVVDPVEEDESGRRRPRARQSTSGIVLSPDMSDEQQQRAAAEGIARLLLPDILRKLDVPVGSESKQFASQLRGLAVPRLLIPTRLLRSALRECKYDVLALKAVFTTASAEMVALRLLDLDDPCVIAVVDDGVVAVKKSNRFPVSKKLEPAEQECVDRIMELDLPQRVRIAGWTVNGWPVPDRPFRRILLRAVLDDV
ncbi:MAG: hypothetical protein L0241_18705 [Planctomycetia bacterium]|nr:hypothetical protein [Planctomycetia bacterium]